MRHRHGGVKLNRTTSHKKAMFRNMVTSLFKYDRIQTTQPKAKLLRSWADHLIGLAKRGDLHARRQALAIIREKNVVHHLFDEAPTRYEGISGGYTRIIKAGTRKGDAAPLAIVELVAPEKRKEYQPKPKKQKQKPIKTSDSQDVKKEASEETSSQS